jgi:endonuclease/exonuclease/phosphatase (EEP) superfamily protein YafD
MTLASAHPGIAHCASVSLFCGWQIGVGDRLSAAGYALLMVVNIHAVNFSLGVDVYSKQLLPIGDQIAHHSGPVIMAGDFNAWSRPRMNALYRFAREMSLREVRFLTISAAARLVVRSILCSIVG